MEGALRRRAEHSGTGASAQVADAWLDLGRYLAWGEPGDREERAAAAALETSIARRPSVAALLDHMQKPLTEAAPVANQEPEQAVPDETTEPEPAE